MIKLFRHIRKLHLVENKTSKYFKYAIGEIALVMVGILLALQVNTWNENRNQVKKEVQLLKNLKDNVSSDIRFMKRQDSIFSIYESDSEKALNLFYKAKTIKDIDSVMKLSSTKWNELYISKNTYNEMVSSGSMYGMQNDSLKKRIMNYYTFIEAHEQYIRTVNEIQSQINISSDLYSLSYLLDGLKNPKIDINQIDTSWITNRNSKEYLALYYYLNSRQGLSNRYRREVFKRIIDRAQKLELAIEKEFKK